MANFHLLLFFIVFLQSRCCAKPESLEFIDFDLYCRDNDNYAVDWWIIYKPPRDTGPYFESGTNFTYITSQDVGRWQPSDRSINENSMLQLTLDPLYKKIYKKHLAVMSYGERRNEFEDDIRREKSTAFGLMFANSESGLWLSHSVSGFPNLAIKPALFPEREYKNGHVMMCLTVNVPTLNAISALVRHTEPTILKFTLPDHIMLALPEWTMLESVAGPNEVKAAKTKLLNFETQERTLRGVLLARSPDDSRCLYTTFAKMQGLVVDVYSHAPRKKIVCKEAYSLRYIDSISLKFPEISVYYINNQTDKLSFGVSTAAHWQRSGHSAPQHWTCSSNIDERAPSTAKGSLLTCLNHYHVWQTFDNFKIKEPQC